MVCILLLPCAIFYILQVKPQLAMRYLRFNDVFLNWQSYVKNAKCGRAQRTLGSCLISVDEGKTLCSFSCNVSCGNLQASIIKARTVQY